MTNKTATGLLIAIMWAAIAWMLFSSFTPKQTKTYKFEFTAEETQVIFDALGELPAKKSEAIRFKIASEVNNQNQTQVKQDKK